MTDQDRIEALEREVRLLRRGLSASIIMIVETLGVHQKGKEERDKAFEQMHSALALATHVYSDNRKIGDSPMLDSGDPDE